MQTTQLVVQVPGSSLADLDDMIELEDRLVTALGTAHRVDSHSFGSGVASILIHTRQATRALTIVRAVMAAMGHTNWTSSQRSLAKGQDRGGIWPIGRSAGLSAWSVVARSSIAGASVGTSAGFLLVVAAVAFSGEPVGYSIIGAAFGFIIGLPLGIILGVLLALGVRLWPDRPTSIRQWITFLAVIVAYVLFGVFISGGLPVRPPSLMAVILSVVALTTWLAIPMVLRQPQPTWKTTTDQTES